MYKLNNTYLIDWLCKIKPIKSCLTLPFGKEHQFMMHCCSVWNSRMAGLCLSIITKTCPPCPNACQTGREHVAGARPGVPPLEKQGQCGLVVLTLDMNHSTWWARQLFCSENQRFCLVDWTQQKVIWLARPAGPWMPSCVQWGDLESLHLFPIFLLVLHKMGHLIMFTNVVVQIGFHYNKRINHWYWFFFFWQYWGLNLGLHLRSRCSTTWAMPPALVLKT
jgi:hypothetical protein